MLSLVLCFPRDTRKCLPVTGSTLFFTIATLIAAAITTASQASIAFSPQFRSGTRNYSNYSSSVYNPAFSHDYQITVYDEYVHIGDTAVFKCHIPNFIRDQVSVVSWIQDNGRVIDNLNTPKAGAKIFSLNGNLFFVDVKREDNLKSFKCQVRDHVTNELKVSPTSGKLTTVDTSVPISPSITSGQRSVHTVNGDTVNLICIGHGYPPPKYFWYKRAPSPTLSSSPSTSSQSNANLFHIHSTSDFQRIFGLSGTGILVLKNVTHSDSGRYVCVVNNTVGEDRATFDLHVRHPLSVHLKSSSAHLSNRIQVGGEVSLTCNVVGYPVRSIQWTVDGRPLNFTSEYRRRILSSAKILTIYKIERKDQGCYRCTAAGDDHETASDQLCLQLAQDPPKFRETFRQAIHNPGDSVSLKCVATGNPLPTVTWILDGFPIPETHRIQYGDYVSVQGNVVSYVNITSIRLEDGGLYQCEAINDAGSLRHSEMVHVRGKPFIRPMGNVTVLAGQQLTIRCPASGYPLTRISWFKDTRELPINERHKVGNNGTLLISEARRELDEGRYICQATNQRDQIAKRDVHIQVLRKPSISSFSFPSHLTEGMRVIVTCNVLMGDPPISVEWMKDNVSIDSSFLDVEVSDLTDLGSSLVFRNIQQKHAGNYTCTARNQVGQDSHTALMVVKVPPQWTIEPSDQSVIVGDRVTFDCQAAGYPIPLIRWKIATDGKNEFRSISSNYHIQTLENGSLVIREAEENDSSYYMCEAENGVGTVLAKMVKLSVHIQAHFKSGFQVVRIRKGNPMNISCEAFGEKPVNIKWLKDRTEIDLINDRRYSPTERETPNGLVSFLLSSAVTRHDSGSFVCVAWNPYGQSEMTTRVLIEEVPDPPSEVIAYDFASKSVSLRYSLPFSGNSPVIKYLIQWKRDKDSWSSSLSREVDGSSSHILITDLSPLTTYDFRVFAINAQGKSEASKVVTITTDEEAPTEPPSLVKAEAISSNSILVRWKPPKHTESFGSVSGYYVGFREIHSEKQFTFKTVDSKMLDKLQYVVNHLKRSTSYKFIVQVFNSKGTGPQSTEVIAKTLDKDPPMTPSLKIVSVTATSIRIAWSLPDDSESPSGYRIFLRPNSHDLKAHETINDSKANMHTISSLRCGSKYQVYMVAFNEVGESEPTEALSFQTDGGAPIAPDKSSLIVVNATFLVLQLSSWQTTSCPINNFVIQYKEHGHNEWNMVSNTVSPILDSFIVNGLQPATWYNLLIAAQSDAGSTEAEYYFATLTEHGGTIAPMSVAGSPESYRLRRYVQMVLPITCVFISVLVVIVFVLFFGFKRQRALSNVSTYNDHLSSKGDNISMSSTKVVYESNHREDRNSLYCQSPYATTRVSLYFQDNPSLNQNQAPVMNNLENSYDMPLLKSHATNRALYGFQGGPSQTCDNTNLVDIASDPSAFAR